MNKASKTVQKKRSAKGGDTEDGPFSFEWRICLDDVDHDCHGADLLVAILNEDLEGMKAAIDSGADLNSISAQNGTRSKMWGVPLHVAVKENRPRAVEELLKLGADPFTKNDRGEIAIHLATDARVREILESAMSSAVARDRLPGE